MKSLIDSKDMSGKEFLSGLVTTTPNLVEYMQNATNGGKFDFKETNGVSGQSKGKHYRGMTIGETGDGLPIFASARDIGNIGAGYVAAVNGMSWKSACIGFDTFQSYVSGGPTREGQSTRLAEAYGYRLGYYNTNSWQKAATLRRSINDAVNKAYNWVKSMLFE